VGHVPVAKPSRIPRDWKFPKRGLAVVLVLVGMFAVGGVMLASVWPTDSQPPEVFVVQGMKVSDLQVGQPIRPEGARFWLVKEPDGGIIALSSRDPRNGCTILWRPEFPFEGKKGWFREPCHSSTYDAYGHKVFGLSPRDMDRYEVSISGGGQIRVDTDPIICSDGSQPCEVVLPIPR